LLAMIAMSPLHRRQVRPAHRTRGPLGVQAARALIGTSLSRLQSAAPCLGSPRRIISAHAAASNRVLPKGRLRFRSHDDYRVEAEAATKAVQGTFALWSLVCIRARRGKPDVSRGGTDLKQPAPPCLCGPDLGALSWGERGKRTPPNESSVC
jgi:hypothetical protein